MKLRILNVEFIADVHGTHLYKDSRAAEGDNAKVTYGAVRLLFFNGDKRGYGHEEIIHYFGRLLRSADDG